MASNKGFSFYYEGTVPNGIQLIEDTINGYGGALTKLGIGSYIERNEQDAPHMDTYIWIRITSDGTQAEVHIELSHHSDYKVLKSRYHSIVPESNERP